MAVEIPFTPRAKRVLELALEEARQLGHNYIGTEHLLLGLLREGEGVAARVLENLDADPSKIRSQVIRMVGESQEAVGAAPGAGGAAGGSKTPTLEEFGSDLTKQAEEAKLDPCIGRQNEIIRVTQILGRRTKNNPCLIGEPGVGKSAIAEGLAQKIAANDVPETLEGKVWVAGFVFTTCPSTCPVVTKAMADLRERFDKMGHDVEMVSFTVDPAHDTPEVLAEYYSTIGVETDKWRFVTGEPKAVISLVRDGFRLGVGEREADEDGVAYDIAHSTKLALVGPDGDVRGYYGIEPDEGLDEIYHRAQHLLREMRVQESER